MPTLHEVLLAGYDAGGIGMTGLASVVADSFIGDGSALTNLPLPAISDILSTTNDAGGNNLVNLGTLQTNLCDAGSGSFANLSVSNTIIAPSGIQIGTSTLNDDESGGIQTTGYFEVALDLSVEGTVFSQYAIIEQAFTVYGFLEIFPDGIAFFGGAHAQQQAGGAATAGNVYTAAEKAMLQTSYNCLRTFGLLS